MLPSCVDNPLDHRGVGPPDSLFVSPVGDPKVLRPLYSGLRKLFERTTYRYVVRTDPDEDYVKLRKDRPKETQVAWAGIQFF